MKLSILALILFISDPKPEISYRKLTFEDFQGRTTRPINGAIAFSTTELRYGASEMHGGWAHLDSTHFRNWMKAKAVFVRTASVLQERKLKYLEHEQIHFDITELHARILNTRFTRYFLCTPTETTKIKGWYDSVSYQMRLMHKAFDTETKHAQDTIMQAVWRSKIDDALKRYPQETSNNYFFEFR